MSARLSTLGQRQRWEALRPGLCGHGACPLSGHQGLSGVLERSETGPFLLLLGQWRPRRAHFRLRDVPGWVRTSPWSQEGVWQGAEEGGMGPLSGGPCPGPLCLSGVIHVLEPACAGCVGVSDLEGRSHACKVTVATCEPGLRGPGGAEGVSVCRAARGGRRRVQHHTVWCTGRARSWGRP